MKKKTYNLIEGTCRPLFAYRGALEILGLG